MIDFERFKAAMIYIGKRTSSTPDPELLDMYHEYLNPLLTTDEFLQAARGVFVTEVFFPPPVAFLRARMRREWRAVMSLLDDFNPPNIPDGWHGRWMALTDEAQSTIKTLGGPLAFKEQIYNRNVTKACEVFEAHYTEALQDLSGTIGPTIGPTDEPAKVEAPGGISRRSTSNASD